MVGVRGGDRRGGWGRGWWESGGVGVVVRVVGVKGVWSKVGV